jgi:undecaprenyl-diphosphatase
MLELWQAIVLGLVQGLTEFLPVSSSAHLVLVPWWLGWQAAPSLVFDTTLHLGTLVAVLAVLYGDVWRIVTAWLGSLTGRSARTAEARLGWWLILGTIPAVILGVALQSFFERLFDSPPRVAGLLLVTGLILALAERFSRPTGKLLAQLGWRDAVLVGLAQAVAIAPGISRSGATIAAGLARGLHRAEAARFSFLLSIPIIFGAGLQQLAKTVLGRAHPASSAALASEPALLLLVGFVVAALVGYLAIRFLLSYVQRRSLYPFAIYCWVVGIASLIGALLG